MNDAIGSLLIALPVGAAIAILFMLQAQKSKAETQRLQTYCAQRGYRLETLRQRLRRALVIHGDEWQLTIGVETSQT